MFGSLALAIAALAALIYLGLQIPRTGLPSGRTKDPISDFNARFDEIKQMKVLRDRVGYLGDKKPKDVQSVMAFMLTQYALAPVVVEQGNARAWVVGNFFTVPPTVEELRALNLEPVRDFGNGVVLYRRVP